MKRFFALLTAVMLLFSLAACGSTEQPTATESLPSTSADMPPVPITAEKPVPTTTAKPAPTDWTDATPVSTTAEFSEETDFSALALIGFSLDDEGNVWIDRDSWQETEDYDLFRKYFFGTWENAKAVFGECFTLNWENAAAYGEEYSFFVVDDSEKSFLMNDVNWRFTGFYKVCENALAFTIMCNAGSELFWLDIDNPDRMYAEWLSHHVSGRLCAGYYKRCDPPILIKTDLPPNEHEENFLSVYKLRELSRDYGVDFDMLVDIEYSTPTKFLEHNDWYEFYPVYLVSEASDRLEFKTQVGSVYDKRLKINTKYTIEKIGGEWVRTVAFDTELNVRES